MTSWTGSESQRKPQGICLPPKMAPAIPAFKYVVPAVIKCEIRRVTESNYRTYTTTKEIGFQRAERKRYGMYEFRMNGWMIRVRLWQIKVAR